MDTSSTAIACDASPPAPLPYDQLLYVASLAHLGAPLPAADLPCGIIERPIAASSRVDAFAPWPYVSAWEPARAAAALSFLRDRRHVTLTAVFRPDPQIDLAGLRSVGIECRVFKDHFVFDRGASLPPFSSKARGNLTRALEHWRVEPLVIGEAWPRIATLHDRIAARRPLMAPIAKPPREHFRALARVDGMAALGAYDSAGLGGALVVALTATEVHCHLLGGGDRYLRHGGAYALFHDAVTRWGGERTIYMGGAPAGPDGPGIAKFKRRCATRTAPVWLATAVLDADVCRALGAGRDAGDYFPPYRK